MRKFASLVLFAALFLGFAACEDEHSKAFQTLEKDINKLEQSIQTTDDCDDLRLFSFSILGLKSDVENLQSDETVKEGEIETLTSALERIEAMWNWKLAALDCQEPTEDDSELDTSGEDDDFTDYNIL